MPDSHNIYIISDAVMSKALTQSFSSTAFITVSGTSDNLESAVSYLKSSKSEIVLFDTSTIGSASAENFAGFLRQCGINFFAICKDSAEGFAMLESGAKEMFIKKNTETSSELRLFSNLAVTRIVTSVQEMTTDRVRKTISSLPPFSKLIAIGSSTGGTEAVLSVVKELPYNSPPILITQHMPPVFTSMYAKRLHEICKVNVWEARNDDKLEAGTAYVAPGQQQMRIVRRKEGIYISLTPHDKNSNLLSPSVDLTFDSVADVMGKNAIGVILTGMGADGAQGLLKMRNAGAYTIGQDKKSCIVYGMPRVAYECGAVVIQSPLDQIPRLIKDRI